MESDPLDRLQERLGWRFTDPALLTEALTHASADHGRARRTYERLEFLGDRVLGLAMAHRVFAASSEASEGQLALRFNALVNRSACARAARRAGLGEALILSSGEADAGGRDKEVILGDACEAVIGALFLDGGFAVADAFIARFWAEDLENTQAAARDPKTALQEWAAAARRTIPLYRVVARDGPDHAPRFLVEASVGADAAQGEGGSKRDAERAAAAALLARAGADV